MIIKPDTTLTGCTKQVLSLVDWLESYSVSNSMTLQINEGLRPKDAGYGSPTSAHISGLALDFNFVDRNVFECVTFLWQQFKNQVGNFKGATEFEVCRGGGKNHIHVAFVAGKNPISWTGVYK